WISSSARRRCRRGRDGGSSSPLRWSSPVRWWWEAGSAGTSSSTTGGASASSARARGGYLRTARWAWVRVGASPLDADGREVGRGAGTRGTWVGVRRRGSFGGAGVALLLAI